MPSSVAPKAATSTDPIDGEEALDDVRNRDTSGEGTRLDHHAACAEHLHDVLKDADPVISFVEGDACATFYAKGDRWALCDITPETTTIQGMARLDATYDDDVTPWRVSTNVTDFTAKHMVQVFVAGGLRPRA